jgi:hypothetical protein
MYLLCDEGGTPCQQLAKILKAAILHPGVRRAMKLNCNSDCVNTDNNSGPSI